MDLLADSRSSREDTSLIVSAKVLVRGNTVLLARAKFHYTASMSYRWVLFGPCVDNGLKRASQVVFCVICFALVFLQRL